MKCDGTRAETRFCLSAKRTSPFKSAGASVQSTTGSRGVRISDCNAGYTMFRGGVKGTGYRLNSTVNNGGYNMFRGSVKGNGYPLNSTVNNAGYNMFPGSVKGTGYPLHSPVSPSLPHPCVTVWRRISTGVYQMASPVCHLCTNVTSAFSTISAATGVVSLCVIIKLIFKFYSDDRWGIYICDQPIAWALLFQDTTEYRCIL